MTTTCCALHSTPATDLVQEEEEASTSKLWITMPEVKRTLTLMSGKHNCDACSYEDDVFADRGTKEKAESLLAQLDRVLLPRGQVAEVRVCRWEEESVSTEGPEQEENVCRDESGLESTKPKLCKDVILTCSADKLKKLIVENTTHPRPRVGDDVVVLGNCLILKRVYTRKMENKDGQEADNLLCTAFVQLSLHRLTKGLILPVLRAFQITGFENELFGQCTLQYLCLPVAGERLPSPPSATLEKLLFQQLALQRKVLQQSGLLYLHGGDQRYIYNSTSDKIHIIDCSNTQVVLITPCTKKADVGGFRLSFSEDIQREIKRNLEKPMPRVHEVVGFLNAVSFYCGWYAQEKAGWRKLGASIADELTISFGVHLVSALWCADLMLQNNISPFAFWYYYLSKRKPKWHKDVFVRQMTGGSIPLPSSNLSVFGLLVCAEEDEMLMLRAAQLENPTDVHLLLARSFKDEGILDDHDKHFYYCQLGIELLDLIILIHYRESRNGWIPYISRNVLM